MRITKAAKGPFVIMRAYDSEHIISIEVSAGGKSAGDLNDIRSETKIVVTGVPVEEGFNAGAYTAVVI
jgi:hypothetical protein